MGFCSTWRVVVGDWLTLGVHFVGIRIMLSDFAGE